MMCAEYGDAGTTQFRHKRITECAVFVSSAVAGDTRYEPQNRSYRQTEAHRLTPRPHDTENGEIPTSAARERQAKAEGNSRQRCVETANGTQTYRGRNGGRGADSIRKAGRAVTSRWRNGGREERRGGNRETETERPRKMGYRENFESDTLSVTVID